LIADVDDGRAKEICRVMRTVRLGEGVDQTGRFSDAAMERTFTAVAEYAEILAEHEVDRRRFVATSASRDARNSDVFVAGVSEWIGVDPEVISGEEEAALSFKGATAGRTYPQPTLVFDIGGGSTEFILGAARPQSWSSVNIGCVRLTERLVTSDPLNPQDIEAVERTIEEALDTVAAGVALARAQSAVGLAGTVTTVAALALDLPGYLPNKIDGTELTLSQVESVVARLLSLTTVERSALAIMQPGRADVICSGALILRAILRRLQIDTLHVSEHDILDGIALSLTGPDLH
jgi:exopolyphosphatase/guanosine-5'-triphosphate,3'-diphosphate pyrophosphatase